MGLIYSPSQESRLTIHCILSGSTDSPSGVLNVVPVVLAPRRCPYQGAHDVFRSVGNRVRQRVLDRPASRLLGLLGLVYLSLHGIYPKTVSVASGLPV